ncbi:MAG: right-handed parallel beta-helix repeat-containing protein, partial [Planctomycetota bacterium]
LEVVPTQLDFFARLAGPNPPSQILSIRNTGTGTLNWQTIEICDWLEVVPISGQSSGQVNEVAVSVDANGLTWGRYSCELWIVDPCALNSPQSVPVNLVVEGPIIDLSPSSFQFLVPHGAPNPNEQILGIGNAGGGTLNWQITEDCPWLEVTPGAGQASSGAVSEVTLGVDVTGLAAGPYYCELTISDPNAQNSPQTVPVALVITVSGILHVPLHYPTIQAAINAAADGDHVVLAEGSYTGAGNKNLGFGGKAITVRSTDPEDPAVVAATVIDCQDSGRGFNFQSGEDANSVVSGLTITGGMIVSSNWGGGGIMCGQSSSPTIENCVISNNQVQGPSLDRGVGGGVSCDSDSNPIIRNCKIIDNQARGGDGYVTGYPDEHPGGPGLGAGVCSLRGSNPLIINCLILQNHVYGGTGGDAECVPFPPRYPCDLCFPGTVGGDGAGGGVYAGDGGSATIVNCVIAENGATGGDGGARHEDGCGGGPGGPAFGGGIAGDSATIEHCTIVANWVSAGLAGGGAADGEVMGSGIKATTLNMRDSIVWDNNGAEQISSTSSNVTYCDVQGGWPGTGNIDADPRFVSGPEGDYYLSQTAAGQAVDSPCVDAGSDTAVRLGLDQCTTRTDGAGDEGIADMGYHYGNCGRALPAGDIDEDGDVDGDDYALFAAGWYCREPNMMAKGTAVVDGNLSEWNEDFGWIELDKVYLGSPNDVCQAKCAVLWDPNTDKIYAAVVVQDGNHVFSDEYVSWDASDRIEIYTQGDAEGGTGWYGIYDAAQHYMVGPNTAGGAWATWALGDPIDPNVGLEYAVSVVGNQIRYEVGIPQF